MAKGSALKKGVVPAFVICLCFSVSVFADPAAPELIDHSDKGYLASVPANIPAGRAAPILICLPAVGITAKKDINNWASLAGQKGLAVLDLDVDYSRIASFEDVDALCGRIIDAVDSLAARYPVNKKRLYIAGTSAGGMMAISLGLRYCDVFIAVGVVSGAALRFGADVELPHAEGRRFYMVHGAKDAVVPLGMFDATRETLRK